MGRLLGRTLLIDGRKLERLWHGIAFGAWNSFICVLCLNLILAVFFRVADAYQYGQTKPTNPLSERYEKFEAGLLKLYPGMSERQVNGVLNETSTAERCWETSRGDSHLCRPNQAWQ